MSNSQNHHEPELESFVSTKDERSLLNEEIMLLQRTYADIQKHHSAGVAGLREREQQMRAAAKTLAHTQRDYEALLKEHEALQASHSAAKLEVTSLQNQAVSLKKESAAAETHLKRTQAQLIADQEKANQIATQCRELEQRMASLSQKEQKLAEVNASLLSQESTHAALQEAVTSLTQRQKMLQSEITSLEEKLQKHQQHEKEAQINLQKAQQAFEAFQKQSDAGQRQKLAEIEKFTRQINQQCSLLQKATDDLATIRAESESLQQQNLLLKGAEEKLREINQRVAQGEARIGKTERSAAALQQSIDAMQSKLKALEVDEKMTAGRMAGLKRDEATLREAVAQLLSNRKAEQERFAEAQAQNAELEVSKEKQRQQLVQIEARLLALQGYENDLDSRYKKLAELCQGSPEIMKLWQGIEELKATIAEVLPQDGIQARPETQVKVVPRRP